MLALTNDIDILECSKEIPKQIKNRQITRKKRIKFHTHNHIESKFVETLESKGEILLLSTAT